MTLLLFFMIAASACFCCEHRGADAPSSPLVMEDAFFDCYESLPQKDSPASSPQEDKDQYFDCRDTQTSWYTHYETTQATQRLCACPLAQQTTEFMPFTQKERYTSPPPSTPRRWMNAIASLCTSSIAGSLIGVSALCVYIPLDILGFMGRNTVRFLSAPSFVVLISMMFSATRIYDNYKLKAQHNCIQSLKETEEQIFQVARAHHFAFFTKCPGHYLPQKGYVPEFLCLDLEHHRVHKNEIFYRFKNGVAFVHGGTSKRSDPPLFPSNIRLPLRLALSEDCVDCGGRLLASHPYQGGYFQG